MKNKNQKVLLYRNVASSATGRSRSLPTSRHSKPVMRRRSIKHWVTIGLCGLLLIGGFKIHYSNQAHAEALAAAAEQARITAAKQVVYKTAVQAVIDAHPDTTISVAAINLEDGVTTQLGSEAPFTAASTGKLLSAITYYHFVEQNELPLNPKVEAHLKKMIELSDNDSWQYINDTITHDRLAAYAAQLGMTSYDVENNIVSAHDMGILIEKFYRGDLINSQHKAQLLQYMKDANYRDEIVSNVPADYTVYHKIGFTGGNIHDVAILTKGGQAIALVIYTNGNEGTYNSVKRQAIYQPIVAAALKAYF